MSGRQPFYGKIFQGIIKGLVYISFRPKIVWKDKELKKQAGKKPYIFVLNHTSHIDGAFSGAVLGRFNTYILVARDQCERKKVGWAIKLCRIVQVDRYAPDADWFFEASQLIKEGKSMIIYPEGGISRDGAMKLFKPGAAMLAVSTGAEIIPCAVSGGYHFVFGKRQRIVIGQPISPECPEDMRHSIYAKQLIAQVQDKIGEMLNS